tara:strand:+ start:130 stop:351 length:222 start_codon:yes stop_codon:yes gene_type:complete
MEAGIPASLKMMRKVIKDATGHDPYVMGLITLAKQKPDLFPAAAHADIKIANEHIANCIYDNLSFNIKNKKGS